MKQENFIIFLHIQKTGGMSLQRILRRRYGKSFIQRLFQYLRGKSGSSRSLKQAMEDTSPEDRYFAGHICFGAHRYLPQPSIYISLFREPVSRLVSLWEFSRSNPLAYYYSQAHTASLEEFLLETKLMELDNGMTRFIAGDENDLFINRTAIGECDEKLLDKAIYNLDNWFAVTGLVEKFDETVLLLGKVLGWRNSFYLPRNRGKDRKKPDIGSSLVEKIKARNYLDVRLYEYIQKRFYNDLERYGISEDTVNQFRKKNELYSQTVLPVYEVYDSMKALIKGEWNRPR